MNEAFCCETGAGFLFVCQLPYTNYTRKERTSQAQDRKTNNTKVNFI